MTVSSQLPRNQYAANGTQTTFTYSFEIIQTSDIAVYVNATLKTLTTDYTVTGAGTGSGGTVVFNTAPASGAVVTLIRAMAYQRSVTYQNAGPFYASDVNADIDQQVLAQQQLQEKINRSIGIAPGYSYQGENLAISATAAQRASLLLGFDPSGNVTLYQPLIALPFALTGLDYPRVNSTATGYELRTPAQVLNDIGGNNASNITAGTIGAAYLPTPTATTLGGVQSLASTPHQFITSITTSGVPVAAQPAASDISGLSPSATTDTTNASNISTGTLGAARLPVPTSATLGGVKSLAATSHYFLTSIGTDGGPVAAQPAASDISGLASSATTDTTNASNISSGTIASGRISGSYTGITGLGTISVGTWQGTTIGVAYGGTGTTTSTGTGSVVLSVSPALTGTPTAPTAAAGTNTGQIATTQFVTAAISSSGGGTVSSVAISGGTTGLTTTGGPITGSGTITLSGTLGTANGGTGTTTGTGTGSNVLSVSPALTGTPTAPTAAAGTSTTQIASTQFATRAGLIRGYIAGLNLSTAGSSTTFGISPGVAADSTVASMMSLSTAYTKTTAAWAVGSGNGALDTGTITASNWYAAFLIQRTDTGVVDVIITKAVAGTAPNPTLPTGYTLSRYLGQMYFNSSSQWTGFNQKGDTFICSFAADFNSGSYSGLATFSLPRGVNVNPFLFCIIGNSAGGSLGIYLYDPANSAVQITAGYGFLPSGGGASTTQVIGPPCNLSGQVGVNASYSGAAPYAGSLAVAGWIDRRGQDS